MTVYSPTGRRVEIVGADLSGTTEWRVWWTYAEEEFEDGLADRHRGINEGLVGELAADGGAEEVFDEIETLSPNRVRGERDVAEAV